MRIVQLKVESEKVQGSKLKVESKKVESVLLSSLRPSGVARPSGLSERGLLIAELEEESLATRRRRDKLSNAAREAWKNGASQEELANWYVKINEVTEELKKVYDKKQHVERFGKLPEADKPMVNGQSTMDISAMKLRKTQLNYQMSKLRKNLKDGKPKNEERKNWWAEQLAVLQAEWDEIDGKIKRESFKANA